jgi:hypothetical protein
LVFFSFSFSVFGIEPRASSMMGKHFATWTMLHPFCLYFALEIWPHWFCLRSSCLRLLRFFGFLRQGLAMLPSWPQSLDYLILLSAGIAYMCHHTCPYYLFNNLSKITILIVFA